MNDLISFEEAKELFDYDPEAGVVVWIKSLNKRAPIGREAGNRTSTRGGAPYYREIRIKGRKYRTHRIAWLLMTGEWPKGQIDHIDGDGENNKWSNLREADYSIQQQNRKLSSNNKSGVMGVYWYRRTSQWRAAITVRSKVISLGYFDSFEDAREARKRAEICYGFHPNNGRKQQAEYPEDSE